MSLRASDTYQGWTITVVLAVTLMPSSVDSSETHILMHTRTRQGSKAQECKLWRVPWVIYSQVFVEHRLCTSE